MHRTHCGPNNPWNQTCRRCSARLEIMLGLPLLPIVGQQDETRKYFHIVCGLWPRSIKGCLSSEHNSKKGAYGKKGSDFVRIKIRCTSFTNTITKKELLTWFFSRLFCLCSKWFCRVIFVNKQSIRAYEVSNWIYSISDGL